MRAVISVLFGSHQNSKGWISEEYLPSLPPVGIPVMINLEAEETLSVEGQVYRTWEDSETSSGGMFIYGGSRIPDPHFQSLIENAGWQPLTHDALKVLTEAVENTPIIAATHEVLLVAGDHTKDPDLMRAFRKEIQPYDPTLPLFGQRLRINVGETIDADSLDEEEIDEKEWMRIREEELEKVEKELYTPKLIDPNMGALPAVTIYSARGPALGAARIVLWTPSLSFVEPLTLIANDWEQIAVPDRFSPHEFHLKERILLALRTTLKLAINTYGNPEAQEWYVTDPETVTEEDYSLLPPILVEKVKADKEFLSFENILESWQKEL